VIGVGFVVAVLPGLGFGKIPWNGPGIPAGLEFDPRI
jgi:hypothetical protein